MSIFKKIFKKKKKYDYHPLMKIDNLIFSEYRYLINKIESVKKNQEFYRKELDESTESLIEYNNNKIDYEKYMDKNGIKYK